MPSTSRSCQGPKRPSGHGRHRSQNSRSLLRREAEAEQATKEAAKETVAAAVAAVEAETVKEAEAVVERE
jgi:hypothetical protein